MTGDILRVPRVVGIALQVDGAFAVLACDSVIAVGDGVGRGFPCVCDDVARLAEAAAKGVCDLGHFVVCFGDGMCCSCGKRGLCVVDGIFNFQWTLGMKGRGYIDVNEMIAILS
jgi:hypothetical protein